MTRIDARYCVLALLAAMLETPVDLIQTPRNGGSDRSDLLADVLAHIRLSGALFLRGQYAAPWAFDSPDPSDLVSLLAPGAERLIVFHFIRRGSVWVTADGARVDGVAGDVVVLPHGHRHVMGSHDAIEAVPIADLLPAPPWAGVPVCRVDGPGEVSEIACGYFRCDELLFNGVLRQLPAVFRVRPGGATADMLNAAVRYIMEEPSGASRSGGSLQARVPELLLVEALRLFAEAGTSAQWLAATGDPVVGRALKLLHEDPTRAWSVDELARAAASSRSVLNERFHQLLGQSPMRYLVSWRMQIAADLLRTTGLKIADIAERSGYGSDVAFSRAFQRHVGTSPAQWRANAWP
jgi:AraC-like DNA-binding protein